MAVKVKKRVPRARLVKQLDALFRKVVFARDGYKCLRTGKRDGLQCCHVYSRRYLSTRWDLDNAMTLTAGEHLWWHHKPLEASEWFAETYPHRAARLRIRAMNRARTKIDLEGTRIYLEQELRKYE